jgi:PhnB protein
MFDVLRCHPRSKGRLFERVLFHPARVTTGATHRLRDGRRSWSRIPAPPIGPIEETAMTMVHPYLNFDGNCQEAFDRYRSIFGGEFGTTMRYGEAQPDAGDAADWIMHISLPLGEGQAIMGSDRPPAMGTTTFGDSVAVSIAPSSSEEGRRIFEALAAGGVVQMPYARQFWGDDYGLCTDRFGIVWMVNYHPED